MRTFIENVADELLRRFGTNLSGVTVVFPGKRASLFLNQALADASPTPVWAPRYRTISELFADASPYTPCDQIEAVCRLYQSYARHIAEPQSIDMFYAWGEVLLSDFDDVDKHLVDARQLFANIRDIKELDTNDYITPEQEEALRQFFGGFSIEDNSLLKERFLELWNAMYDIYADFRTRMQQSGVLYDGALQRDVVERLRSERFATADAAPAVQLFADAATTYAFVGFNVLNNVEQALFDELQRRGRALFFWDYDVAYTRTADGQTHEAGHFVLQNLQRYGNALTGECFDNLSTPKQLTIAAASSENIQARLLPGWLQKNFTRPEAAPEGEHYAANQTAVVLCNEQLLLPVLHSLPSDVGDVNVTMGYPLSDTLAYSFVLVLVALHAEGYDSARHSFRRQQLRSVEQHPYARLLGDAWRSDVRHGADLLTFVAQQLTAVGPLVADDVLASEAVFKAYTCVNRLIELMSGTDPLLAVSDATLSRLLRSALQRQSIPFHGEPAVGLQVMGVLETRTLDFRHVLMLSVGEGYLPKGTADSSFIPYHLRDAFGLTTLRHKIAVYAYYFYRLIQRAERVTFVYNESTSGLRQNEISRFLRQLEAETTFPITHVQLNVGNRPGTEEPITIAKSEAIMRQLVEQYDVSTAAADVQRFLSPSAINRYTTCPLQFYYRYVEGLKVDPEPTDGLDAILFGNVFHRAAELVYKDLTSDGDIVRQQDIDNLLALGAYRVDAIVARAFREEFFEGRPEDYTGILAIARQVVHAYLLQLLRHDRSLTPIRVLGIERKFVTTIDVDAGQRHLTVQTGGIVDRLDEVADASLGGGRVVRVVDYKTGGAPAPVRAVERLFAETGQNEHYFFQTILYACIVAQTTDAPVQPCLFYVHKAGAPDYSSKLRLCGRTLDDVRQAVGEGGEPLTSVFADSLRSVVHEIFDPDVPFTQCSNRRHCDYCDYRLLCRRG